MPPSWAAPRRASGGARAAGGRTPARPRRVGPARPRRACGLALALAGALLLPRALPGQVPPAAHWRTIRTEHFRVNYTEGLDSLARHAGAAAERAWAVLATQLPPSPAAPVELVLSDNVDFSNGLTSPFPYNRIVLYARPPVGDLELARYPDWMEILLDHELTHAFHLDRTSRLGHALRRVFGRLPYGWPFFPVEGTPAWSTEGTAVVFESRLTGQGRIYGSYHDMVLRAATLEEGGSRFWGIDRLTGGSPRWPGGSAAYVYGSFFMQYLAQRFGEDAERRIADATAAQTVPSFARVLPRALGRSWTRAYAEWRDTLRTRYRRVEAEARARGLTPAQSLTHAGYLALYPRVSADGMRVAFVALEPRSAAETRTLDVGTGGQHRWARRNSLDPVSWLPDGRLLTTQLERRGRYHVLSDLYAVDRDGGEARLTHRARVEQADARKHDGVVVAVQDSGGLSRLVRLEADGRGLRPLTPYDADHLWASPRWSPEGGRIAAALWTRGGGWDVVVLDAAGARLARLTQDAAEDSGPAWTPDGRLVLWASDRTGIPNIFAAEAAGGALRQVTNVLGGAFWPDASPDGRWLYFAGYHADGWHIERLPLDSAAWRPLPPAGGPAPGPGGVASDTRAAADTARDGREVVRTPVQLAADTVAGRARGYSPLASLRPRFWLPLAYDEAGGTFLGAATAGVDAIQRHSYGLLAAYDPKHRRAAWQAGYEYAGMGNPVLGFSAGRSWDHFVAVADTTFYTGVRHDDDFSVSATLVSPRVRRTISLVLGADLTLRHWALLDAPDSVRLTVPADRLAGVFAGLGFANYQVHPYSISREDGVAASVSARRRVNAGYGSGGDLSYFEAAASAAAYRALRLPGFAHHVLAARASALWRGGPGAEPEDVGGVSGQTVAVGPVTAGTPGVFLPLRGFQDGARTGTRAWSASLEYRLPVALVDRGWATNPYYLHQLFADAFVDAGNASCPVVNDAGATPNGFYCSRPGLRPLIGTGLELIADGRVLFPSTVRARAGVGFPASHPGPTRFWLTLGSSF